MRFLLLIPVFVVSLSLAAFPAQANQSVSKAFRTWLEQEIWPQAARQGVSRKVFDAALADIQPNLKLPDLVLPGERPKTPARQHQAEFRSPAAYFAEKNLTPVIAGGRNRLRRLEVTLASVERQYGVPGRILLAIWGRESGFGAAKIPHDAFEVLATKAFLSTRKEMFRDELLAALVMAEKGHVDPRAMRSSWAGALGQPQFMPTSFLRHAADGDGDGRLDIWKSEADTLASMARYLADKGWVPGRDWGFEVSVPAGLACSLEGPDRGKPIRQWAALGVTRVSGRPFPPNELPLEGFLLMPAGRFGPAFIVTPNFYVLKAYNESDAYALFVGHAADRIQYGGSAFAGAWTEVGSLLRSDVATMQRALEKLGYDVGGADGLPGFRTRRSIGEWQASKGEAAACWPHPQLVGRIR